VGGAHTRRPRLAAESPAGGAGTGTGGRARLGAAHPPPGRQWRPPRRVQPRARSLRARRRHGVPRGATGSGIPPGAVDRRPRFARNLERPARRPELLGDVVHALYRGDADTGGALARVSGAEAGGGGDLGRSRRAPLADRPLREEPRSDLSHSPRPRHEDRRGLARARPAGDLPHPPRRRGGGYGPGRPRVEQRGDAGAPGVDAPGRSPPRRGGAARRRARGRAVRPSGLVARSRPVPVGGS